MRVYILSFAVLLHTRFCFADWVDKWDGAQRTPSTFEADPQDSRTVKRGSGEIILGNGECIMKKSPRLYIESSPTNGWENTEFTAYGKYESFGSLKSYSGLTLVARSNHDNYKNDGCSAASYYARVYADSGEASFQKEYFHGSSGTVYSASNRVQLPEFENGLTEGVWIGLKFILYSTPDDDVQLELWMDKNNDGTWELVHDLLDTDGAMPATKTVPSGCPIQSGDPVLGGRNVCFLRSDGNDDTTVVHWRDASITKIDPSCKNGLRNGIACCAAMCGDQCGGSGCSQRPGGASACCANTVKDEGFPCVMGEAPCVMADPTCSSGIQSSNDACCAASCGTCGGRGCGGRPGGGSACCSGSILGNDERTCDRYPPPCRLV
uniref:Uncharacterized protein n=1 Tax=Odontella aurita TaxID=265563 RepID=A0A7S4N5U2_9STRA|mmetsp:Transcript_48064/g.145145  ORF Transcript_48064/g.145145 Transcript_48064/m.145145 type:complete len:379 (+) Transcript_48064:119-1255(+)